MTNYPALFARLKAMGFKTDSGTFDIDSLPELSELDGSEFFPVLKIDLENEGSAEMMKVSIATLANYIGSITP